MRIRTAALLMAGLLLLVGLYSASCLTPESKARPAATHTRTDGPPLLVDPIAAAIIQTNYSRRKITAAEVLAHDIGLEGNGETLEKCVLWLRWEDGGPHWALTLKLRRGKPDEATWRTGSMHWMYPDGGKWAVAYREFAAAPVEADVREFMTEWQILWGWKSWRQAINRDAWREVIGPLPE